MAGALSEFAAGTRLFGRGFGVVFRSPKLLVIGAIPAVLTTVLLISALVVLAGHAGDIGAWATLFADNWSSGVRETVRGLAAVLVFLGGLTIGVVTFTALTLLIGGPFYEYMAERIENSLGAAPVYPVSVWRQFVLGLRASTVLVTLAIVFAVPLFLLSLIPVFGQTVVPLLGLTINGWLLALEVIGVPFVRRGMTLRDRHRVLRTRRIRTLGFAMPACLLCLIPVAAIVVMPAAVAGGTLLAVERLSPGRV